MPRRELKYPSQVEDWLREMGGQLEAPASVVVIGSGALLWHAFQAGIAEPLPQASMDVDPVTADEAVAERCYEAMIGNEFQAARGWHVNLMPGAVLREMPLGWEGRRLSKVYGLLTVRVPSAPDFSRPSLPGANRGTVSTRLGRGGCFWGMRRETSRAWPLLKL